jgi:hypothetical protein
VPVPALVPVPVEAPVEVPADVPVPLPLLVVLLFELLEETAGLEATEDVGTVKGGAPAVLVVPDPPPQALTPTASTRAAAAVTMCLSLLEGAFISLDALDLRSRVAPCACHIRGSR